MIKPLRKSHFVVWRVYALLLPCLFFLAILWRPDAHSKETPQEMFEVEMTTLNDTTHNIIFTVKKPLTSASCVIYANKNFLGLINHQGEYEFSVEAVPSVELTLIDFIRNEKITSIHVPLKESEK